MYVFKNKEYETLLEAVDCADEYNHIHSYRYSMARLTVRRDRINIILEEMAKEDCFDFKENRIKTKDDLMKEFNITEF
jgi:hypothetical protein